MSIELYYLQDHLDKCLDNLGHHDNSGGHHDFGPGHLDNGPGHHDNEK